ncbi:hypothetical protein [Pseudomonas putida]|uniref:Uncharacterized protein n=1 Tax=Pseudomonas putida TaxID=303 RepID=A0A6I6XIY3_PSEPU|nr:hypothetical protein [Pseudomonas putida]QHG65680.1 hypothetical protein C2H86_15270 [Pseudomonas putida]
MPLAIHHGEFDDKDKAFMSQALAQGRRALPGLLHPDPRNAGAVIEILRQAGIEVTVGLLVDEAR